MARHLRRLGHGVTVLTTAAYGRMPDDDGPQNDGPTGDIARAADLQLVRARMRGHDRVDSLFDSDTYSGQPHPLSKLVVPEPLALAWAPFAIRTARRLHRERGFDCVITTSPPESAHLVGRAVQRLGAAWIADLRDAWTFEPLRPQFPTKIQRRADERMERRLLSTRTPSSRSAGPSSTTWTAARSRSRCWSRTAGTPTRSHLRPPAANFPTPPSRSPTCSTPSASRSSTPAASAATAATRAR